MNESLVEQIREAFPDDEPPAGPATGHRCPECDRVAALLDGRRWTEVADDFPLYCHDAFPLLTAAAKVYYLPAYMTRAVRNPGVMEGISVQSALERGDLSREAFNPAQRAVILRWIAGDYADGGSPPENMIAYWKDGIASRDDYG